MVKRGFTLIELLVVMSIIGLLLAITAPKYFARVDIAKEAVLAENLRLTRNAIDAFRGDRGRFPSSLNELVSARYLRALPTDPLMGDTPSWTLVAAPAADSAQPGGIADLHSRAPGNGRNGKPYAQW